MEWKTWNESKIVTKETEELERKEWVTNGMEEVKRK